MPTGSPLVGVALTMGGVAMTALQCRTGFQAWPLGVAAIGASLGFGLAATGASLRLGLAATGDPRP